MTPSSSNAPGPAVSSQLSGPSNMLGRLPPQQVTPSAIGKSNHPSMCLWTNVKKLKQLGEINL